MSIADGGAPRAADPPVCQKLPQKVCLALPGLQASQVRLEIQIFMQNNSTNIDLVPAMGGLCSKCFLHVRSCHPQSKLMREVLASPSAFTEMKQPAKVTSVKWPAQLLRPRQSGPALRTPPLP